MRDRKTYLIVFGDCLPIVYQFCLQDFRNVEFHLELFAGVILEKEFHEGRGSLN